MTDDEALSELFSIRVAIANVAKKYETHEYVTDELNEIIEKLKDCEKCIKGEDIA